MATTKGFEETHERILQGALRVFSQKGYSAATIKDISKEAGCNSVTIFRHFEDKLALFYAVVERFHMVEIDEDYLQARLTYTNLHMDLTVLSGYFFEVLFQHMDILRIFVEDGPNFEPLAKRLWCIPASMRNFMVEYLQAMYPNVISLQDAVLITETFLSYMVRTCLRMNVHEGIQEYSKEIAKRAAEVMAGSVEMTVALCLLHVGKA
ncbi:MAG: TetR/AcrR family transcriptional regulator [Oscillospiraceae bacterium]|nr:TetR/AcrR family transcriptional regulator [Oscillospiraceae bacterium]